MYKYDEEKIRKLHQKVLKLDDRVTQLESMLSFLSSVVYSRIDKSIDEHGDNGEIKDVPVPRETSYHLPLKDGGKITVTIEE